MIYVRDVSKQYRAHGRTQRVLDGISFEVQPGQKLALLGRNGAGKSTLIRLLGKVELPTRGTVEHHMRVSWPLGFVGAFQGSLTGLDNTRFLSRIYRTDFHRVRRFIEDFSELGEHLFKPVKFYSSGMRARLAFGLSIAFDFDCYLIDEVILVGDQQFHERCREQLFNKKQNKALVVASHDMGLLSDVCTTAMLLKDGHMRHFTDIHAAAEAYRSL